MFTSDMRFHYYSAYNPDHDGDDILKDAHTQKRLDLVEGLDNFLAKNYKMGKWYNHVQSWGFINCGIESNVDIPNVNNNNDDKSEDDDDDDKNDDEDKYTNCSKNGDNINDVMNGNNSDDTKKDDSNGNNNCNNNGNNNILSSKSKQDSECPFKQFSAMKFHSHLCYNAELARVLQTINMVSQQWKSWKNDLEGVDKDAFTYRYFTSQCFKCKQKTDGCGFTCRYIYSQKNKCLLIKHLQIPKEGHHEAAGVDKSMQLISQSKDLTTKEQTFLHFFGPDRPKLATVRHGMAMLFGNHRVYCRHLLRRELKSSLQA